MTNGTPNTYTEQNIQNWQESTYPLWIDTKNGEVFKYDKYAKVRFGDNGQIWVSTINDNEVEPGIDDTWITYEDHIKSMFGESITPVEPQEPTEIPMATQTDNKNEPVTLHETKGRIKMSTGNITGGNTITFSLINDKIKGSDILGLSIDDSSVKYANIYELQHAVGEGFARIMVKNKISETQTEPMIINFKIL